MGAAHRADYGLTEMRVAFEALTSSPAVYLAALSLVVRLAIAVLLVRSARFESGSLSDHSYQLLLDLVAGLTRPHDSQLKDSACL